MREAILFTGTSHPSLAEDVARFAGLRVGQMTVEYFPDGEVGVQIQESVRGKDVFVLQSAAREPNRFFMELLIIVDAFRRASAHSITVVMPYYPYARQDRRDKGRVPITARMVANLLEKVGVTRVIALDLHTEQIQGFFNIPVDHLYARPLFVKALKGLDLKDAIVVSPDIGSNKMVRKFAEDLNLDVAIVDKRRMSGKSVAVNGIIGDVRGKKVILVDDMCTTGETLSVAAEECKNQGAKSVMAVVTHPLFVGGAKLRGVDEVMATDSVLLPEHIKLRVVSAAPLLAKAIECVVTDKSISSLFV